MRIKTEVETWLEQIRTLRELVEAKKAEYNILFEIATDTGSKAPDGMPHNNTGTVSRKVENIAVDMAVVSSELDVLKNKYTEHYNAIIIVLEKLPLKEYKVLHRYYIRQMTIEEISKELNYCRSQIWRIKRTALKNLEEIQKNQKDAYKCN